MFSGNNRYLLPTITALLLFTAIIFIAYFYAMDITRHTRIKGYWQVEEKSEDLAAKPLLYIGVISRYPPTVIYTKYQPLMDYLSRNTPYKFELVLSRSYEETVKQLAEGKVTAAFLGSYIYYKYRRRYDLQCILKPLNDKFLPEFHAVLITKSDSPILRKHDLRGKKIALPSALSFSSKWFRQRVLANLQLTEKDFKAIDNFPHHQNVIFQVLKGNYDAGVVKENIAAEYLPRGLRIICNSESFPGGPVVVLKKQNAEIVKIIKNAFLQINRDRESRPEILKNWDIEYYYGFCEAEDKDYDVISSILNRGGRP